MSDDGDEKGRPVRVIPGPAAPDRPAGLRSGRTEESDEAALVAAFLVGDDRAFAALVRRNEDLVLRIVRRYARTPEDGRDLAQRTFLRAFEAARRGVARGRREPFPFRRWLVRIAANLAKNHLRDEARWTRAPLGKVEPAAAGAAADEAIDRARAEVRVRRAVLRLPRRQREVLTLRVDGELPFAEIALALGITENAAKVSFHHATRRLVEAMREEEGGR